MGKVIVALLLAVLASCSIPYSQLSPEVAVKQVAWPQGIFFYRIETSIKNTGSTPLSVVAKCSSMTGGMQEVRHANLQPGEVYNFTDKVPTMIDGSASVSCDYYKKEIK